MNYILLQEPGTRKETMVSVESSSDYAKKASEGYFSEELNIETRSGMFTIIILCSQEEMEIWV